MIFANKEVGETPLELLDRIRKDPSTVLGAGKLELKNEKLSYAGRLDPMAEGQMLILVGEEENKNRKKYLGLDKEYEVEFLAGAETDTGDVLGLINSSVIPQIRLQDYAGSRLKKYFSNDLDPASPGSVNELRVRDDIKRLIKITKQKYPWFSSKTVNGKPLWQYYKEGNLDVERPVRKIQIKRIEFLGICEQKTEDIKQYIFDSIRKVKGDFRQEEILERWRVAFGDAPNKVLTFKIKILVSSGTYIRALTEDFDFPVCVFKLKRTKIII